MGVSPDTDGFRTAEQNRIMWALLGDIAAQVVWHGQRLTKEEWKWVFSAAVRKQKMVAGIDGGLVLIGFPTSAMSKQELSDMIDCISAFGNEQGVDWSDPP